MRSRIRPGAYRGRSLRLKQLHTSGSTTPGIMELYRLSSVKPGVSPPGSTRTILTDMKIHSFVKGYS
jgi:hypothetical protein